MYVGLRFKSNPVLTLPHVPVRSKGKQCQEYCRPIDFIFFFFPSLFQGITGCYVFILPAPLCYPGIPRDIIIPGYLSVSLGDLIHHTTSPHSCHEHDFPRGMKFSIFDSLPFPHPLPFSFFIFLFPFPRVPLDSKTKRETGNGPK